MQSSSANTEFQQYWLILKRHWLPISSIFTLAVALTALFAFNQEPIYEAEGKLRLRRTDASSTLTGVATERSNFEALDDRSSPLATEISVIRTIPIAQETINTLHLTNDEGTLLMPNQFLATLSVSNAEGTDVLSISYQDKNRDQAKKVVDTLMEIYLKKNLQHNRAEAVAARTFIESQLPEAERRVRNAEAALRLFKEESQVVALDQEASSSITALNELQGKISAAEAQLASLNAQFLTLQSQLNVDNTQSAILLASLSQSEGVQEILQELQKVEAELANERARFREETPPIAVLERQRANLSAVLQQVGELEVDLLEQFIVMEAKRRGLAQEIDKLGDARSSYQQRMNLLPQLEQEQRELERQLQASQSTYSLLLQKLQEVRVVENQNVGNAQVIQPAFADERPVAPRKSFYVMVGMLLGGLLSSASVLFLESRDQSIRTVEQAKAVFGFTVLGMIPAFRRSSSWLKLTPRSEEMTTPMVLVRDFPRSSASETYRMLQTNLKFINSDQAPRVIVITSSLPKEGKSTTAANLAMAIAQTGRTVLIVDADLHHPVQHHIWTLNNQVGLSNVLVGDATSKSAITKAEINLFVLTSGAMPPNPTALLDSQRMSTLLAEFAREYDFVILDTPSLNVAASASIVGKMSDGILLVTRVGMIDTASAIITKSLLDQSNQKVLGQVVNNVNTNNEPHLFYHALEAYHDDSRSYVEPSGN
jgi:polysaccharide biosynthesis transport protein